MSSSKQVRAQFKLNDLEPRQDPKGGTTYEAEFVNLQISDPGGGAILGATIRDGPLIKARPR